MGPEIRPDKLDRLIDDAVEQAEASVSFVSELYGTAAARSVTFGRKKRADDECDSDYADE